MVYIVFLLFLLITIYTVIKKYWLVSTYIVGIYTIMMLFATLLAKYNSYYVQYSYTCYLSSILFGILMLFYFIPYFKTSPIIEHDGSEEFIKRFSMAGYVVSIVIIIGMVLLFPTVMQSLTTGLGVIRRAMYLDETTDISYGLLGNLGQRILSKFGWLGYTNLLLFFLFNDLHQEEVLFESTSCCVFIGTGLAWDIKWWKN